MIFLDSSRFTQKSLADLASSLEDADYCILKKEFNASYKYLTVKGVYLYEYVSSLESLNDKQLPPIEAFYSSLKRSLITEEEYEIQNSTEDMATFQLSVS